MKAIRSLLIPIIALGAFSTQIEELPSNIVEETPVVIEENRKRDMVISSVIMMLFLGIAIGTVNSNNPK